MNLFLFHTRQQTDEQLMARVAEGSHQAFDELYRRYAARLQGFFFRQMGGDQERAADATQDVFLRLFESRHRYQQGNRFATWLFTIAYNLCKNQYRHQEHEANYLARLDAQNFEECDVELQMDRETFQTTLQTVLDSLPPPLRMLFSLRYEEELSVPQIAGIEQIPEGTVKSRLHKTLCIIRQKLKEYEDQ